MPVLPGPDKVSFAETNGKILGFTASTLGPETAIVDMQSLSLVKRVPSGDIKRPQGPGRSTARLRAAAASHWLSGMSAGSSSGSRTITRTRRGPPGAIGSSSSRCPRSSTVAPVSMTLLTGSL
jgi:hypothetical protein